MIRNNPIGRGVPLMPEMESPEPSEAARRLGQTIYAGLLYTSAENIALCLEDYAQAQNAALRAEVEALRARVAWKRVGEELPPMDEKVMCYTSNGFFVPMKRTERNGTYWVWVDDTDYGWFESRVTHWQPLPDKPSE